MAYRCSFAGVTFRPTIPAEVQARLDRFEWLANVRDVLPRGQVWPPKNLYDLGFPKQFDPPAVAIGDYFYPTNASRWSIFRGYMTRDDVDAVKAEVWPTSSQTPTTGTFLIQSEGGDSEGEVETELYMLPPIPVAGLTASDPQIFLVTLVDERYFWHQFKEAGVVTCTSATATWSDLIDQLATQLDIDLTYETPDSDYGSPEPDSALYSNQESPAILLDAAAANIGCVVVRALDGTYSLQRYADAIDATETNRPDSDNNVLGGRAASKSDSTSGDVAYRGLLPASVTVSFPKWVDGAGYYEPTTYRDHVKASYGATYTKTVTLEDAGFSGYAHHDGSKMLRTSAKARYTASSDPSPNNQTTCDALAAQLAADYFATRLAWLDEVYAGIYPWTPEGVSDLLYSWRDGSVYTRILPPPFNAEINDFQHGFGPLAVPAGLDCDAVNNCVTNNGDTTIIDVGTTCLVKGTLTIVDGVLNLDGTPMPGGVDVIVSGRNQIRPLTVPTSWLGSEYCQDATESECCPAPAYEWDVTDCGDTVCEFPLPRWIRAYITTKTTAPCGPVRMPVQTVEVLCEWNGSDGWDVDVVIGEPLQYTESGGIASGPGIWIRGTFLCPQAGACDIPPYNFPDPGFPYVLFSGLVNNWDTSEQYPPNGADCGRIYYSGSCLERVHNTPTSGECGDHIFAFSTDASDFLFDLEAA